MSLARQLEKLGVAFRENEPMNAHTTFGIGGAADFYIEVRSEDELICLTELLRAESIPMTLIGNGSDLLVSDRGIDGAVVKLSGLDKIWFSDGKMVCGAGAKLVSACKFALENGLTGLEFAYGIPGTVGGAVYMNAGAYGGEIKQVLSSVRCLTEDGRIETLTAEQCLLAYRQSVFMRDRAIILSAEFSLEKGEKDLISARMTELLEKRKEKQPLDKKSAGSTFKRPEGYYAAALIEECGLKGASVGDAEVSRKHAGFIVNNKNASCADVLSLMELVKKTVASEKGVELEPEVIVIGRME